MIKKERLTYRKSEWNTIEGNIQNQIIQITSHAAAQMQKRQLHMDQIQQRIWDGSFEIIQGHSVGSYVFQGGMNADPLYVLYVEHLEQVFHVVLAEKESGWWCVTAYYPSLAIFSDDLKTLRKKSDLVLSK